MYKDDLTDLFKKALREGDGESIWRALNPHLPSASSEASSLFNDPNFNRELDHFIEKNRLSIGTAHIRYKLRLALLKLKVNKKGRPIRRFQIPAI